MIPMTLARIAEVVGGTLHDVDDPSAEVTGSVEFDSRRIDPGGLFLALPGARSDGHDHAAAAVAAIRAAVFDEFLAAEGHAAGAAPARADIDLGEIEEFHGQHLWDWQVTGIVRSRPGFKGGVTFCPAPA